NVGMLCKKRPIEPARFIILAIGIVIPTLCPPHFVTHEKHGHTNRKHRYRQKVLHLPISNLLHSGIIGKTFNTAVPTSIVIRPVAIVFAICFVVFAIIRDQVVERETVVTRHEVDALLGLAFLVTVNLGAAKQAVRKASDRTIFPTKKTPNIIWEP